MTALARTQTFVATPHSSISSNGLRISRSASHPKVPFSMILHPSIRARASTLPASIHPCVPRTQWGTGSMAPSRVER